jgi:hypothetical protein
MIDSGLFKPGELPHFDIRNFVALNPFVHPLLRDLKVFRECFHSEQRLFSIRRLAQERLDLLDDRLGNQRHQLLGVELHLYLHRWS